MFSPFIVDATVTLVLRLARGERIWVAHRRHAYQRLVLAGWSARRLVFTAWALMAAAAASAFAALGAEGLLQRVIIVAWAIGYALAFLVVSRRPTR